GGLYFPEQIPVLSEDLLADLVHLSKGYLALQVMKPYVGNTIPQDVLLDIVTDTVNFDIPLVPLHSGISALELFHGPTLAFKDVGARFMSRSLGYFNQHNSRQVTVLVATSGDTGGAVANGFENVDGVEVVILYPAGKVSPVQELQLTTCGTNISALKIDGSFDDCQAMVKRAFKDADLAARLQLTSANSINVARWLPQQLYYFFALQQWQGQQPPVISVPSGNFGNICAGMLAHRSGLPVQHFIAACNANDTIPQYLATGNMPTQKSVPTLSNAMDVALPSNFVRIMEMYGQQLAPLKSMLTSVSISDADTEYTIREVFEQHQYTLDPHGAIGYKALQQYLAANSGAAGFFLETAHPVKFPDVVERNIGQALEMPPAVKTLLQKPQRSTAMAASFDHLKAWLLGRTA
ncbi:MAG: threonine synthase, partial [Bacteroidetes bacterium]